MQHVDQQTGAGGQLGHHVKDHLLRRELLLVCTADHDALLVALDLKA
jgi:hypothetical protein